MHRALNKPFFIFGDARSGNTFLAWKIHAHMNVAMPPESLVVPGVLKCKSYADVTDTIFSDDKFNDWRMGRTEIESRLKEVARKEDALLEIFNLYCEKHAPDARAFGLQKDYIDLYPRLRRLLPGAKILWLVRDGRAVFNSKKKSIPSNSSDPFETNPKKAALIWIRKNRALAHYAQRYGTVLKIRYEDLVSDTPGVLKKISDFLELPCHDTPRAAMEIPERYAAIHSNVGETPLPGRIDSWQAELSESDIRAYESIGAGALLHHGYATVFGQSIAQRLSSALQVSLEDFGTNLRRMRYSV
jgi:hypothetical protein